MNEIEIDFIEQCTGLSGRTRTGIRRLRQRGHLTALILTKQIDMDDFYSGTEYLIKEKDSE